ncbi:phosphotransferase [Candidatus Protofrankia datiscae]|nr:phosphotransferase [Candidatus Protofrankia datiscae]
MLDALPAFLVRALPSAVDEGTLALARETAPIAARSALPDVLRTAFPALGREALNLLRDLPANLLRGILPRNVIARGVADRMAAEALRDMVGRSLLRSLEREVGAKALTRQGRALIQQQLARELEEQLARNFGARVAARSAESHVARLAAGELAQQVTRATLGREAAGMAANVSFRDELARYLGTRMAMGAGIMGGGNLLGQFLQVADGHRAPGAVDFGEAGLSAVSGAAFGAGMWGSPLGHILGGGVAGGTLALGTQTYDHFVKGEAFSWSDVAAGAGHGAAAGALFGTLNHVQTSVRPLPLKIGQEVVAVPGEHGRIGMLAHDAGAHTAVGVDVAGRDTFGARFGGEGFKPTEIVRMDAEGNVIGRLPGDVSTPRPDATRGEPAFTDPFTGPHGPRQPAAELPSLDAPVRELPPGTNPDGRPSPSGTGSRDAGSRDAGPRDAGPRDAGPRDGGLRDGGLRDGGSRDGALRGGGPHGGAGPRAGLPRDGGPQDGFPQDGFPQDGFPRGGGPDGAGDGTPPHGRPPVDTHPAYPDTSPRHVELAGFDHTPEVRPDNSPPARSDVASPAPTEHSPPGGTPERPGERPPAPGERTVPPERPIRSDHPPAGPPDRPTAAAYDGPAGPRSAHPYPHPEVTSGHAGASRHVEPAHSGHADHAPLADAMTGASIRPRDEVAAWEWADSAYDRFRAGDADIADIAGSLAAVERPGGRIGFTPEEIGQIKRHLMVDEHLVSDYEGGFIRQRFDADPDIAEAWIRLREGRHLSEDLGLLEHELAESDYLRGYPDATYPQAHGYANSVYNWQDVRPGRTGENLDTLWGRGIADGDSGGFREGPGRQTGGRVHLRVPEDGPPSDHRQGVGAGESAGREQGRGFRGGVRQDLAGPSRWGGLAGEGFVRGVEGLPRGAGRIPDGVVPVSPPDAALPSGGGPAVPSQLPRDPAGLVPLEEPIGADVPVVGVDQVGFSDVVPAQPAESQALTPEWVRDILAAPKTPEQVVRWVREHLTGPGEDGTMVPKSAAEIDETVARLQAEAAQAVAARSVPAPDAPPAVEKTSGLTPIDHMSQELAPSVNFPPELIRTGADLPSQVHELVGRAKANLLDKYPEQVVAERIHDLDVIAGLADRVQSLADRARASGDLRALVQGIRDLSVRVGEYADTYRNWRDFDRGGEFADPGWRDLDGVDPLNSVEMANRVVSVDPATYRFHVIDQAIVVAKIGDILGPEFEAHAAWTFERTIPMDMDSVRALLPDGTATFRIERQVTVERPRGFYDPEVGVTFVNPQAGDGPRSLGALAATVVHEGMHALQPSRALLGGAIETSLPRGMAARVHNQLTFEREYQGFAVQQEFLRGLAGHRSLDPTDDPRIPNSDGYRELAAMTPEQLRNMVLDRYIPQRLDNEFGGILVWYPALIPESIVQQARSAIIDATHPIPTERQYGSLHGPIMRHVVDTYGLDLDGVRQRQSELLFPALRDAPPPAPPTPYMLLASDVLPVPEVLSAGEFGHDGGPRVDEERAGPDFSAWQAAGRDGAQGLHDAVLEQATESRTPTGLVDNDAVSRLADQLPRLEAEGGDVVPALTEMAGEALGFGDASLQRVGGEGAKGHSGAPVFLIRDPSGAVVAVVKVFPRMEEFVRELSSIERLRSDEFTRLRVPEVRGVAVILHGDAPAGVLLSSVASGRAIDDIMAAVHEASPENRLRAMEELKTAVSDTAAALAELHTRPVSSGRPVAQDYLDFHTGLARRLTSQVSARADLVEQHGLDVHELSRRLDEAIDAARRYPGKSALVHGDAHPGNFFWDRARGVTFIDTPTFHYSMNHHGEPIASPERDVSNFEQRLAYYSRQFSFSPAETKMLLEHFRVSYREAGGSTLHDGTMRMFGARSVLNKLLQIVESLTSFNHPDSIATEHGTIEMKRKFERELEAEIDLLKKSLGWEE